MRSWDGRVGRRTVYRQTPAVGLQWLFYWCHKVRTQPRVLTSWERTGYRWWTICRPADEERLNYGFITVIDLPYSDLVEAARQRHRRIYQLKSGKLSPVDEKPRYN